MANASTQHKLVGRTTSIKDTGEVVEIKAYYVEKGKFEGEICDLARIKKSDNTLTIIEAPLLTL